MSVRAYPIKSIEYGTAVFNCWHDEEFMALLSEVDVLFYNEGSQIEIARDDMAKLKKVIKGRKVTKITKAIIAEINQLFKETKEDYIVFDCF